MGNQIELRHLRYFLAVAEELHFRKAAERLYISQPGLSRQIKQMEGDLGLQLFTRDNKKVQLTEVGQYLKTETTLLLKNLDDSIKHAQMLQIGQEGKVTIGYVGSAMQNIIPALLIKCRELYPNIRFSLKEMDNDSQVKAAMNKSIDLGFVRLQQSHSYLEFKPVLKDTFSLVLPKDHRVNNTNFKNLKQLENDAFILFDKAYSPSYYERVMSLFEDASFAPKVSHHTVHANTIFRLVENHFGVAIIPTSLKEGYATDAQFIELKSIKQRAILSAMWHSNNRNPILKKVLDLL
jgi:DNA-binding transcriptional LysR family regulator